MNEFGFIRAAACSPRVKVADTDYNTKKIIEEVTDCVRKGANIIVFPELSITGYSCGDLFGQSLLIEKAQRALVETAEALKDLPGIIIVGLPVPYNGSLYNCAAVLHEGIIAAIIPKQNIPNYGEFYEKRWFRSGKGLQGEYRYLSADGKQVHTVPIDAGIIIDYQGYKIGIEICEDLWVPEPPSGKLVAEGADIICNLSATNELAGKHDYLKDLIRQQSARCLCGYVYASAGTGESSTDLAFAGNCIIAENGAILAESPRFEHGAKTEIADLDIHCLRRDRMHFDTFSDLTSNRVPRTVKLEINTFFQRSLNLAYRKVSPLPFIDTNVENRAARFDEIISIQAWGLATRMMAINCQRAVIGVSGGLDSTLALLVTAKAFDMLGLDKMGIICVSMPGFGTTERTKSNASQLIQSLNATEKIIPIEEAVKVHFSDIGHDPEVRDVTYENSQARERTQILMDIANQENALVIGTGDLSELALGWCTYNGDHMSMYAVNSSIPKTLVKHLVEHFANTSKSRELKQLLTDIIDTPISPELLPPSKDDNIEQKTENLVGPYELHDFFLYHTLRHGSSPRKIFLLAQAAFKGMYEKKDIMQWMQTFYKRFFSQQFKRSCMPDGIKASSVSLSPRGDWRMPSDASATLWLDEVNEIINE